MSDRSLGAPMLVLCQVQAATVRSRWARWEQALTRTIRRTSMFRYALVNRLQTAGSRKTAMCAIPAVSTVSPCRACGR